MSANITLLTDFGTRDGYVGAMKGVVLSQCADARIIDITHDVAAQDIAAGAWALRNAWPWFPEGTIHVIVVDPGVGSERRSVLVEAGGQFFIGPDNGVIPLALGDESVGCAWEIANPDAMASVQSATFHGRDVFSWCAGWLAAGNSPDAAGPRLSADELVTRDIAAPMVHREGDRVVIEGEVVTIDRFGNLITNIPNALVETEISGAPQAELACEPVAFGRTFSDVAEGELIVYPGSSGVVEVAVNLGSAAERFAVGAWVVVRGVRGH